MLMFSWTVFSSSSLEMSSREIAPPCVQVNKFKQKDHSWIAFLLTSKWKNGKNQLDIRYPLISCRSTVVSLAVFPGISPDDRFSWLVFFFSLTNPYKVSLIHKQNKVSSVSVQFHQLDLVRVGHLDVVIDPRRADTGLAGPWIDFGAWLTRTHITDTRFVPQVAYLRVVAAFWTILMVEET